MIDLIEAKPFFQQAIETSFKETGIERIFVLGSFQDITQLTQSYLVQMLLGFIKLSKEKIKHLNNPHLTDLQRITDTVPDLFDRAEAYEQIGQSCKGNPVFFLQDSLPKH